MEEQTTHLSCAETAKLVRGALKENFPSQKFSVRSSTYSMGASIDVSWTNGVGSDDVNKIIKQFEGAGFDGMIDYKYYVDHWMMPDGSIKLASKESTTYSDSYSCDKPHPDAKKISFGADYVFANREISEEVLEKAAKDIAKLNDIEFTDMNSTPDGDSFDRGNWWNISRSLLWNEDLTDFGGVVRTDITCGRWDEFYKVISSDEITKLERITAYKEKREAKAERYAELAEKAANQSIAAHEASNRATENIPFGQPILVGHHSERAHRNAIKRSWNAMDKAVELSNKADYYAEKADATKNNNAISSDNPEAIDLLKEKLIKLEDQRTQIKEFNKNARKEGTEQQASYMLSNLAGNIATVKKRIEKLEKIDKIEEIEETINGVVLKTDKDDNRVRLFFDGKPSEEIRTKLKSNGFRWSPYNGCWQRQLNPWAIKVARDLIQGGGN